MKYYFLLPLFLATYANAGTMDAWSTQQKGANFFSNIARKDRFEDAVKAGIIMGRLAGNKWLNGRPASELGDFLIGPKDKYSGIVKKDLTYLIKVLDDAHKAGLKIVFTMLSLPGSRWLQHNCVGDKCAHQYDLWKDFRHHQQSASFWRDLAKALKNHPAIIGYNIINEPCPERAVKPTLRDWYTMDYGSWYQGVKGTPADLNLFYKTVIQAIREVDQETPIVLDSGFYSNPYAFQVLDPGTIDDNKTIFSIHHYEPSRFLTDSKNGHYSYPGNVPSGELDAPSDDDAQPPFAPVEYWDRKKFDSYFKVTLDWMKKYQIPTNRIYVAEFGGRRETSGLVEYFKDAIEYFNLQRWHWSFYSYREDDGFPQMDYELGTGKLPEIYWRCSKAYTCEKAGIYKSKNPLWQVIQSGLKL